MEKIQHKFFKQWNFPKYCGATGGKRVPIKHPPSGSQYYNHKGTYSITLFEMVDADYCFTYINVGANGRAGNSAIFRDSALNTAMEVLPCLKSLSLEMTHFLYDLTYWSPSAELV